MQPGILGYRFRLGLFAVAGTAIISLPLFGCTNKHEEEVLAELKAIRQEMGKLREDLSRQAVARRPTTEADPLAKKLSFGEGMVLGNKKATVALVEFSDYQCPFCARFHRTVFEELKKKYIDTGQVLYVFHDFPLPSHGEAKPAAVAARCAGEQGAYWAMQRVFFGNQQRLGAEYYRDTAKSLGLRASEFSRCIDQGVLQKRVEKDMAYGQELGVSGTPTFFVGRIRGSEIQDLKQLKGAQPYEAFATTIDGHLGKIKKN